MPEAFPPSPSIQSFSCRCEPDGWGSVWLELAGELDLAGCPQLRRALIEAQGRAAGIAVDLRELTFIDCAGLAVLFRTAAQVRGGGGIFCLVGGSGPVKRLLDLTGVPAGVERLEYAFPRAVATPRAAASQRRRGPRRPGDHREEALRMEGA